MVHRLEFSVASCAKIIICSVIFVLFSSCKSTKVDDVLPFHYTVTNSDIDSWYQGVKYIRVDFFKREPQSSQFKIHYIYEHVFKEFRWWDKKFADIIEFHDLVRALKGKNITHVDFYYDIEGQLRPYPLAANLEYAIGYVEALKKCGIEVDHFYTQWFSRPTSGSVDRDEKGDIWYIEDHIDSINQFLEKKEKERLERRGKPEVIPYNEYFSKGQ